MALTTKQKSLIVRTLKSTLDNLLERLHDERETTKELVLDTLKSKFPLKIEDFEDRLKAIKIKDNDIENPIEMAVKSSLETIHDVVNGNIEELGARVDNDQVNEYSRHVIAVYFLGARPDTQESFIRKHGYQVVLGIEDSLKGTWNIVRHPIVVSQNVASAAWNYKETASNLKKFASENRLRFFTSMATGALLGHGASYICGRVAGAALTATELLTEFETLVNTLVSVETTAGMASSSAGHTLKLAEDYQEFFIKARTQGAHP